MKQEERLFDLIGNLPDDLTAQTEAPKRKKITPKQQNRWIGIAVAACLVVAAGVWGITETPAIGLPGPALNWPLLNSGGSEATLNIASFPVNDRLAMYYQVENPRGIPKEQRPQYLGAPYLDLKDWYLPANTSNPRYLVHEEQDGSYTLWEFSSFVVLDEQTKSEMAENLEDSIWATVEWFSLNLDFDPYPYSEVLETIYGITGAEDIRSVTVNPANMDNSDEGKKLQKKIGTHAVWKEEELEAFYEALSSSICYGSDHWELIDLGEPDLDGGLSNQVRMCRYLTLETTHGTLDNLKYSAAGGQFYEYSGIAYEPLGSDLTAKMNDIFNIEP